MDWNKKILLCFLPLLILGVFLLKPSEVEEARREPRTLKRSVAGIAPTTRARPRRAYRREDVLGRKSIPHHLYRNRVPQSVEESLERDPSIKVTKGYDFISGVKAIPHERFKADLGSVVQKNEHYTFYRSEDESALPVAISKKTNSLYPISSVLHVKEATPSVRKVILSDGYEEYYYHAPLKYLSLKAKSSGVLKTYSDLKEKGYAVELEVMKPQHKNK
jgi:hypothetical protein